MTALSWFFQSSNTIKLSSCFIFGHKLGKGGQGSVLLAKKVTGADADTLYTVKIINKKKYQSKCITKESEILANLNNPFIIKWHYTFQTEIHDFTVFDYHCGHDLFNLIEKKGKLSEEKIRFYLAELVVAIHYLHSIEIIHGLVD